VKLILNVSFFLSLLALTSCDTKSTDPIDICVDAKIELYIHSNSLSNYCSILKLEEEGVKHWIESITQKSQNENDAQKSLVNKFSKNLIKQHDEKVKLCSNRTISNFKKLDIRDDSSLELIMLNGGEFPPMNFRKQCLEKFTK
jgi:hypothetical protein